MTEYIPVGIGGLSTRSTVKRKAAGKPNARSYERHELFPPPLSPRNFIPTPEDIEYYLTISSHGLGDDVIDPYLWSIDEALEDFTSAGIEVDPGGYVPINHHCQTNVPHVYAAGDLSGKLPLSSVASMQGRKIAEHVVGGHTVAHRHLNYDKAASAIFTEPEIADVGLAEADAFAEGRKIRVTKVPFAASAKALINNDPRGFVKAELNRPGGARLGQAGVSGCGSVG